MWNDYVGLLGDGAHWMFEITLMLIFDVLIGLILWPVVKRAIQKHDDTHHNNWKDKPFGN